MSNFKTHAIAGILFGLPFAPSVFYLFFALLGASIPDLDHKNNEHKVCSMFVIGICMAVFLSLANSAAISALIIVLLAIIFYLSKHRGFTHTFIGIFALSFLFTLVIMGFMPITNDICLITQTAIPDTFSLFFAMVLLGYFVIRRKYFLLYACLLAVCLLAFPVTYANIDGKLILMLFLLGSLSHIVLDLCTPKGLAVFKPFFKKTYHKFLAILLISLWIVFSFYWICFYDFQLTLISFIFTYS